MEGYGWGYTEVVDEVAMRDSRVFLESFLDGFGVAGLGAKLQRPGAPTRLFAEEEPAESETSLSNALAMLNRVEAEVKSEGRLDLRMFPEETALLRRLVEGALKKKRSYTKDDGVRYGTSHGVSQ